MWIILDDAGEIVKEVYCFKSPTMLCSGGKCGMIRYKLRIAKDGYGNTLHTKPIRDVGYCGFGKEPSYDAAPKDGYSRGDCRGNKMNYPTHTVSGNEDIRCAECHCTSPFRVTDKDRAGTFTYYSCQCGHEWGHENAESEEG